MSFPFNIYFAGFIGGAVFSWLLLPLFRPLCQRWGWVDAPGHRKIHDSPIPLAGGFSVLAGMLVPLVLAYFLIQSGVLHLSNTQHYLQHGIDRRENELL